MPDALNPMQFTSLDYANADVYSGLLQRPPTATPLNIPLGNLSDLPPSKNQSPLDQAINRSEQARQQSLFREQQEAQQQRELALREREIARNQALARTRNSPAEQPVVNSRDYEKKFPLPSNENANIPQPSTGSPPGTSKGTAAIASSLVEPTAPPRTGALPAAAGVGVGVGVLELLPRALPQAAGRLALPAIGGGIDFANRVVHGQSVGHAATSAVAGTVGAVAGFAIGTAIGGPLLGYALGAVGGMVAGSISDSFHETPTTGAIAVQPLSYPPFYGGQEGGVRYVVRIRSISINPAIPPNDFDAYLWGGIGAPYTEGNDGYIDSHGEDWHLGGGYQPGGTKHYLNNDSGGGVRILSITRADGLPDTTYPPGPSAPPPDNLPYRYDPSPIGDDNTVPSGTPAAGTDKGKTRNVAPSLPSNNTPRGAPFFPGHGGLAPSYTPNPSQTPSNLGGLLPQVAPVQARQPLPFAEPDGIAIPVSASGNASRLDGGVVTQPLSSNAQPIPLNSSRITIPSSSSPIPSRQNATPDSVSPTPKANSSPSPKTPDEAQAQQQKKDFDDQIGRLTAIATAIAALTPAIQGIPDAIAKSPAVQAATGTAVQGAVCEIAQPTGCLGAPIQRAEDAAKANGNKLNDILTGLNTAGSAAQLALLDIINGKLGDQLPGGIGGKLSRFADWMHLDRVLNILILAATFHNALMLSNDIGQTLVGAINNLLQLIGLKKEDGSAFDIGSVISSSIENLIKGAIGADNYTELKEAWAKANRIYQATTNVINSFLNLSQTILQASELIAAYTGKIGNALKKGGVILESAYGWMNPQPKFNRVTQTLESLQNGASTIQMVTQAPLDVVNAVTESTTAATEFVKAVKEDDKPVNKATPIPEPDELKAKETQSKTDSQPLTFDFSDLFDGED